MALATGLLRLRTDGELAIVDITDGVRRIIAGAGVTEGIVNVFVTGSTAAVTTMEHEPGGVEDLRETLERLVPRDRPDGATTRHNVRNHDDNAHSHLRASLLGPSETIPLRRPGGWSLGTWQQLVLIELDDRPREREHPRPDRLLRTGAVLLLFRAAVEPTARRPRGEDPARPVR